jgi:hypothetical protein
MERKRNESVSRKHSLSIIMYLCMVMQNLKIYCRLPGALLCLKVNSRMSI